jgi:hypothetical protein
LIDNKLFFNLASTSKDSKPGTDKSAQNKKIVFSDEDNDDEQHPVDSNKSLLESSQEISSKKRSKYCISRSFIRFIFKGFFQNLSLEFKDFSYFDILKKFSQTLNCYILRLYSSSINHIFN